MGLKEIRVVLNDEELEILKNRDMLKCVYLSLNKLEELALRRDTHDRKQRKQGICTKRKHAKMCYLTEDDFTDIKYVKLMLELSHAETLRCVLALTDEEYRRL